MEGATTFYLTQGVLGITVFILGTVVVIQDKRFREDLKVKDDIIALLQEKRVEDVTGQIKEFLATSDRLLTQMRYLLNVEVANQKAIEMIAKILKKNK